MAKSQPITAIQARAAKLQELYGLSADEAEYLSGMEHGWDTNGDMAEPWGAPEVDEAPVLDRREQYEGITRQA